ncbi:nuclease-related domain-containing protein [Alkalihalobacillus sp. AL-G]|uniref:nuclease-related domain-containing protein n=1 Tax=Alkalihalobacillus sp. AL-G TaxID=2926399 RepID=UPI00272A224D|nr:nuclease-related domain-containing protein [Alkalihalobacillus sp. AL-G]WLD94857.1 NERD domain-containing protein [Alkalihalobacillus sp. AL-G]
MKELKMPIHVLQLLSLAGRIRPHHVSLPQIEVDLRKCMAGYKGEKAIEYHLRFLDKERYLILHDLRLRIGNTHLQIDVLILTPHCYIITEVKNIQGTLYFDPVFNQLIRSKDGFEEGFQDPTNQVKRQQFQLLEWLKMNNLPKAPLHSFIGISDPKTILKTSLNNHNISKSISHGIELPFKIENLRQKYNEPNVSQKDLKRIGRRLIKKNEPLIFDVFRKYGILQSDILKGVRCLKCERTPIRRDRGKWVCPTCEYDSKYAHYSSIMDYALLINLNFTNREISDFLLVDSKDITYGLLKEMGLPREGRNYKMPLDFVINHGYKRENY